MRLSVKQPDAPETPPELFRLTYFENPDDGRFFIESSSLATYLRETTTGLEKQADSFGMGGDELAASGLYGAAHVLGTIADQIALLPLQDEMTGESE